MKTTLSVRDQTLLDGELESPVQMAMCILIKTADYAQLYTGQWIR